MSQELFDPVYAESAGREVIEPLVKHYFRLKVVGAENIPPLRTRRPIIFVANHAGRTFPWDAILLDYAISQHWIDHDNMTVAEKPCPLSAPELSAQPRLLPFRLSQWWQRMGCVDATALNLSRLLKQGKHSIIFPEGIPGIARDFKDRYQLLPFPAPLVKLAARYNALIVPVSIIGSEYFHPYARKVGWLQSIGHRLGLPFLPLSPFTPLLPFAPWLLYSALPAPVTIVIEAPVEPPAPGPGEDWEVSAQELRRQSQEYLNAARARYEKGMDWAGLLVSLLKAPEPFWKLLPIYWPWRFLSHADRQAPHLFPDRPPNWWFYLPFLGWFAPRRPQTTQKANYRMPRLALAGAAMRLVMGLLFLMIRAFR